MTALRFAESAPSTENNFTAKICTYADLTMHACMKAPDPQGSRMRLEFCNFDLGLTLKPNHNPSCDFWRFNAKERLCKTQISILILLRDSANVKLPNS